MPNIYPSLHELQKAIKTLFSLRDYVEIGNESSIWGDFITSLDLSWIRAERGFSDIRSKFQPFQGKFKKLRNEDPLLRFLKNSRDYYMHSNPYLVEHQIISKFVGYSIGEKMVLLDEQKTIMPKSQNNIIYYPCRLKLTEFYINNRLWVCPTHHLSIPIKEPTSPYEVGGKACLFYLNFLLELDNKFNNGDASAMIVIEMNKLETTKIMHTSRQKNLITDFMDVQKAKFIKITP